MIKRKIVFILLITSFLFFKVSNLNGQVEEGIKKIEQEAYLEEFQKANKYYILGKYYFNKGNNKKAEDHFKKCLSFFPKYDAANYYLSLIYFNNKAYNKALICIEKAENDYKWDLKSVNMLYSNYLNSSQPKGNNPKMTQETLNKKKYLKTKDYEKEKRKIIADYQDPTVVESNILKYLKTRDYEKEKRETPADYLYNHGMIHLKLRNYKKG